MPSFAHRNQRPSPAPATPPSLAHPPWCERRVCEAKRSGPHHGGSVAIEADGIGSARLQLRPWSPSDDPGQPVVLVELIANDSDSRRRLRVDLSMQQIDRLLHALTAIVCSCR